MEVTPDGEEITASAEMLLFPDVVVFCVTNCVVA